MSQSHRRLAVASIAVALVLSGCAAQPSAGPGSPSPAPTSSPETEPVEDVALPAAVVVAGAEIRIVDDTGAVLEAFPYSSDPAVVLDSLTGVFAAPPVITEYPGDGHCSSDATVASWSDDGFTVLFDTPFFIDGQQFRVHATVPEVSGVEITTPTGVSVGDPIDLLEDAIPVEQRQDPVASGGVAYTFVDYDVAVGAWASPGSPEFGVDEYWGAQAVGVDGSVGELNAAVVLVDQC